MAYTFKGIIKMDKYAKGTSHSIDSLYPEGVIIDRDTRQKEQAS